MNKDGRSSDRTGAHLKAVPLAARNRGARSACAVGAASLTAAGVFAVLAANAHDDYENTSLERPSADARDRYHHDGAAALGATVVAVISGGIGWWLWNRNSATLTSPP